MSDAVAVHHGAYGRCGLYHLNRSLPTHAHLESHLLFFISGEAAYTKINDSVYSMDSENVLAVNPLQPHSGEFGREGGATWTLVMYIRPAWLKEMGGADQPLRFFNSAFKRTPEIESLLEQVSELICEPSSQEMLALRLYHLTQACLQQSAGVNRPSTADSLNPVADQRIGKALRLIHHYLKDDVPPEYIASEVGLSRPHFYKLFREQVGVTPSVYQNTLKIDAAIERLTDSNLPVNTIGHELGFSSPASFSRFFTANVGIPPVTYRRVAAVEREQDREPAIAV